MRQLDPSCLETVQGYMRYYLMISHPYLISTSERNSPILDEEEALIKKIDEDDNLGGLVFTFSFIQGILREFNTAYLLRTISSRTPSSRCIFIKVVSFGFGCILCTILLYIQLDMLYYTLFWNFFVSILFFFQVFKDYYL